MTALKNLACFTFFAFAAWLGLVGPARAQVVYQEVDGRVVGEAEIYSERTYRYWGSVSNGWYVVPDESSGTGTFVNARNNAYIQCLPDNGSPGAYTNPPSVSYRMKISVPGTYRLYLRWEKNIADGGGGGTSDSLFADIEELKDGTNGVFNTSGNMIADWYEFTGGADSDFATSPWTSSSQPEVNQGAASGYNAEWVIPAPGIYTLRLSQREDGVAVDAFVFQRSILPGPSGDGPAMSSPAQGTFVFTTTDDTYFRRDDTDALHYAETIMVIKNDATTYPSPLDRTAYLRFDISELSTLGENMLLTNATFKIDLINEGMNTNHDIYVAVIAEDAAAENFSETNLWPGVSDVLDATVDEAVKFTKVYGGAPVGRFEISASLEGSTINFSSPALLNAVRADTDGVLSLVLYRTLDGTEGDNVSSKENTARLPPRLEVSYRPRDTSGTAILLQ